MADALKDALDAFAGALALALPARLVTRDFRPLAQRVEAEIEQGVVSVVCLGEKDYANYRGREADLGTLSVMIVAQLKVTEDAAPSELEDAEFALAGEIKAALSGPLPVRQALTSGFRQSGQIEFPYGWVAFECEVMT